jgi:hypothetical protein
LFSSTRLGLRRTSKNRDGYGQCGDFQHR